MGNIVNRVFDSSGPEGKVRGTPQQIIDKYQQLFRDAQLSNDRVAAENFQQHAEHYIRMLAEAQREQDARQQQNNNNQQNNQQDRQQNNNQQDRQQNNQQDRQQQPKGQQGGGDGEQGGDSAQGSKERNDAPQQPQPQAEPQPAAEPQPQPAAEPASDVMDVLGDEADTGLVETPESKPVKPRRKRVRKPAAEVAAPSEESKAAE